jgi:hypothetical protein
MITHIEDMEFSGEHSLVEKNELTNFVHQFVLKVCPQGFKICLHSICYDLLTWISVAFVGISTENASVECWMSFQKTICKNFRFFF